MKMIYENLPCIKPDELDRALAEGTPEEAARALLRMAINDTNWRWAEEKCLLALHDQRDEVKAAAITSLGHLARTHHTLSLEMVVPELQKIKDDPKLGGIVEDALEDILMFTSSPAHSDPAGKASLALSILPAPVAGPGHREEEVRELG
jgi:hypothetical protein